MGIFLALLVVVGFVIAFLVNSDLFSPVKFYFLSLCAYFYYIFFLDYSAAIYLIYFLYVGVGYILIFLETLFLLKEHSLNKKNCIKSYLPNEKLVQIYMLTLLGVLIVLNLYIIESAGGVAAYINSLHLRVVLGRGEGVVLVWRKAIIILFLILLLMCFVYKFRSRKAIIALTLAVFLVMCVTGALTASRGNMLNGIVFFAVCFHYLVRRIRISRFFLFFIGLLILAVLIGQVRQEVRYGSGGMFVERGTNLSLTHSSAGRYGITPLEGVLNNNYTDLTYGSTYFSAITNFIPRKIWPNKLDTGGVVLTKFMLGGNYTGTTNHSTGYFAEAVINFGYFFGVIFALAEIILISILVFTVYKCFLKSLSYGSPLEKIKWGSFYCITFRLIGALLVGEFTATIDAVILFVIFFYLIFLPLRKMIGGGQIIQNNISIV